MSTDILIKDKIDFKLKVTKDEHGYYIMIKVTIHQEGLFINTMHPTWKHQDI